MKLHVLVSTMAVALAFTHVAFGQGKKVTPAPPPSSSTTTTHDYVEQQAVGGDQVIKFTGDELAGGNGSPGGSIIVRAFGPRVQLIRPRLNFVPELLKSVENL